MTLAEFLLARIAEDEQWARAHSGLWRRIVAECEAKRRIVETYQEGKQVSVELDWNAGWASALELTLELLALPYADHPDYQESWKP